MRRDIDDALHGWPAEPGEIVAREVRARDGRTVVQVRVELGLLQMEAKGRPDGVRPHGFATYLDYLRHRAASRGSDPSGESPPWTMGDEHRVEADREFLQFYHRRIAWLTLQRYERALADADHSLALMDFVRRHGGDEAYVAQHEQFRGQVLFHRTQAAVALAIDRHRPEEAIDLIREGIQRIGAQPDPWADDLEEGDEGESCPHADLIDQLRRLEDEIRRSFEVGKTLREQLAEAVASEDYERAARLRDQIRGRRRK